MLVREACAAARAWVQTQAAGDPRFRGAFFSGSTLAMPAGSVLPATSDVDIIVVVAGAAPPKLGKFSYEGVLLEVAYLSETETADPDAVAASHYLAPSFSGDHVIVDPTGQLGRLRDHIAPRFDHPDAVRIRSDDVLGRMAARLRTLDPAAAWHEQVTAWMFPTSLTAVFVLVAGLRPPTVRLRYLAAREVLRQRGRDDMYEALLGLLGCGNVDRRVVQQHLDELTVAFDLAATMARTPFFFSPTSDPRPARSPSRAARD